jgi:hypothetical protein
MEAFHIEFEQDSERFMQFVDKSMILSKPHFIMD